VNQLVTKKDIIRVISEELGRTQRQTSQIVHNLFDAIVNTVAEEGRVELRDFGVFEVRWRKARQGSQPAYRGKGCGAREMHRHFQAWTGFGETG
jgi:nucleoid DNA-binding protein